MNDVHISEWTERVVHNAESTLSNELLYMWQREHGEGANGVKALKVDMNVLPFFLFALSPSEKFATKRDHISSSHLQIHSNHKDE